MKPKRWMMHPLTLAESNLIRGSIELTNVDLNGFSAPITNPVELFDGN